MCPAVVLKDQSAWNIYLHKYFNVVLMSASLPAVLEISPFKFVKHVFWSYNKEKHFINRKYLNSEGPSSYYSIYILYFSQVSTENPTLRSQ